ncbi:MAG: N-acetylmuramoyl-L-alanine amidase, partial [Saprospiraceae bacterium]|nr:N-acetylmuramoyl-L-alanine amidase [Saprospiraceae bacterium]
MKNTALLAVLVFLLTPFQSYESPSSTEQAPQKKVRRVIIDAGHGGKDSGSLGSKCQEKDIALKIALKLGEYISTYLPDVEVVYTRKTDKFIPLHERAEIANDSDADVFISVHCNSLPKAKKYINGTETYVMGLHRAEENLAVAKRENEVILLENDYQQRYEGYDPSSPEAHIIFSMYQNAYLGQSILLAEKVESQFKNRAKRSSRGVKQAGFVVLRATAMPSILVETGFLSNST